MIAVFDFQSAFDKGVLGKFAANNFRAKISRYELFTTMEDEDREEAEGLAGLTPRFDTPAAQVLAFAKKWLEAEIVVLGKVEEAGGEALCITVKVYDAQTGPVKPRLATTVEVASKYAIQVGVFNILGELTGRKDPRHKPLPADAEERWRTGPSLVRGDFEKGTGHPVSWEPFGVDWQMKEAHWESHPDGAGKCIVFRMSGGVAAMEGVAYYSQFFDIEPGATYRVSVKVKSMAPTVKVFVKYYAWLHTPGEPKGQWREVGRSPMNCKGPKKQWGTYVRDCHPRVYLTRAERTYTPKKCRIGLYAYHPGGVVYFDDVVFKKLAAAPKEAPKPYDVGETGRQPVERKE
ncbi:hypothetical protein HQ576_16805 [bacterium]|nr:hypothetical protein [bacterium]